MASNLSARIKALEEMKGASLEPLFVCTYDDVPLTTAQSVAMSEAKELGRDIIIIHNAPPD